MGADASHLEGPQLQGIDGSVLPAHHGAGGVAGLSAASRPTGAVASTNGGDAALPKDDESALLNQLLQLLHQRPNHSLLLSDLGALLPQQLRSGVKERGGLRSWLQKHPMLFSVTGQPGKESVKLTIGGSPAAPGDATPAAAGTGADPVASSRADADHQAHKQAQNVDDDETAACVQMRGLPYRATTADVRAFLGKHAANLKDAESIQLVLNRDGRPSGFARVQFFSPNAARAVREELHNAVMKTWPESGGAAQERYVEIFLYCERPNKLRFRKPGEATASGAGQDESDNVSREHKEQVVQECRDHMSQPGKGQLLLSMLGVALSPESRLHLKKTDLGLKHFLGQHPNEFRVDGVKGREMITYLPAMQLAHGPHTMHAQAAPFFPNAEAAAAAAAADRRAAKVQNAADAHAATVNLLNEMALARLEQGAMLNVAACMAASASTNASNPLLESPGATSPDNAAFRGMRTPSDWGTPLPGAPEWAQKAKTPDAQPAAAPPIEKGHMDFNNWMAGMMDPALMGMPPNPYSHPGVPPHFGAPDLPPWMMTDSTMGFPGMHPSRFPGASGTAAVPSASQGYKIAPAPGAPPAADESCTLRLRGLPFTCSEQEVFAFFSKHDVVENIADVDKAVVFLSKNNGKPTGQATVQMESREHAEVAKLALHGQWIGSRYIEVFFFNEDGAGEKNESPVHPHDSAATTAGDTGGSGSPSPFPPTPAATMDAAWLGSTPSPNPWLDHSSGFGSHLTALHLQTQAFASGSIPPPQQMSWDPASVAVPGEAGSESWNALFEFLKNNDTTQARD